jgi:hypothetical protein
MECDRVHGGGKRQDLASTDKHTEDLQSVWKRTTTLKSSPSTCHREAPYQLYRTAEIQRHLWRTPRNDPPQSQRTELRVPPYLEEPYDSICPCGD